MHFVIYVVYLYINTFCSEQSVNSAACLCNRKDVVS